MNFSATMKKVRENLKRRKARKSLPHPFVRLQFVTQVIYRTLSAGPPMIVKENSNFIDFVMCGLDGEEKEKFSFFIARSFYVA
jgi:hypothetical protein